MEGDGAHAPAAPPTCVGEASAEEDRRVENKRYSNRHERCACYATVRLREGDEAHDTHPPRLPLVWAKRHSRKTGDREKALFKRARAMCVLRYSATEGLFAAAFHPPTLLLACQVVPMAVGFCRILLGYEGHCWVH